MLFIDLVKAFDRIIREVVLGWSGAKTGVAQLIEIGFPQAHAKDLAAEIDKGAVLEQIGVHPHVVALFSSMHSNSWFQVPNSSEYLVVSKGGRQGCRFGGVIFNLCYARALKKFYAKVNEEGIPAKMKHRPGHGPACDMDEANSSDDAIVFDVTSSMMRPLPSSQQFPPH